MLRKIVALLMGLFSFVFLQAADAGEEPGLPTIGKKDDVNGIVLNAETKKPLEGVSVTAFLNTKKDKVVTTNDEGGFNFDDLRPGTYKFVFEKAGFKKITKEKTFIKTDEAFQLNIEMIELSDFDILPSPIGLSGGF
ncbi:MAG: hypothetical protein RIR12_235 [Bacteroidota bacterium]